VSFNQFDISDLFEGSLLLSHDSQLFFFKDFHLSLFKCLSNQHVQHRLNFYLKLEGGVHGLYLGRSILSKLLWFEERRRRSVDVEVTLDSLFVLWRLIREVLI
jgi:hypothetical protein